MDRIRIMANINTGDITRAIPADHPASNAIPRLLSMRSAIRARPAHRLGGSQYQAIAQGTTGEQALGDLDLQGSLGDYISEVAVDVVDHAVLRAGNTTGGMTHFVELSWDTVAVSVEV